MRYCYFFSHMYNPFSWPFIKTIPQFLSHFSGFPLFFWWWFKGQFLHLHYRIHLHFSPVRDWPCIVEFTQFLKSSLFYQQKLELVHLFDLSSCSIWMSLSSKPLSKQLSYQQTTQLFYSYDKLSSAIYQNQQY